MPEDVLRLLPMAEEGLVLDWIAVIDERCGEVADIAEVRLVRTGRLLFGFPLAVLVVVVLVLALVLLLVGGPTAAAVELLLLLAMLLSPLTTAEDELDSKDVTFRLTPDNMVTRRGKGVQTDGVYC